MEFESIKQQFSYWKAAIQKDFDAVGKDRRSYKWGDPEKEDNEGLGNYKYILDNFIIPFINKEHTILDLGCFDGKWAQYFKDFGKIICCDINDVSLEYIKKNLAFDNIEYYLSNGYNLEGIKDGSVNFIFCMDALVYSEKELIESYFKDFARILVPNGKICFHLPCSCQKNSVERKFTPLSEKDIVYMCRTNNFINYKIDKNIINHGIILRINY